MRAVSWTLTALLLVSCLRSPGSQGFVEPLSQREMQIEGCYVTSGLSGRTGPLVLVLDTAAMGMSFVRVNTLRVVGEGDTQDGALWWRPYWFVDSRRADSVLVGIAPGRSLVLGVAADSLSGREEGSDDMGRRWTESPSVVLTRRLCP